MSGPLPRRRRSDANLPIPSQCRHMIRRGALVARGHRSASIELHVPDDELYWTPHHGADAERDGSSVCSQCVRKAKLLKTDIGGLYSGSDRVLVLEDEEPPVINLSPTTVALSEGDNLEVMVGSSHDEFPDTERC